MKTLISTQVENINTKEADNVDERTFSDSNRNFKNEFEQMINIYDDKRLKVFVYGTLMKGNSNSHFLNNCEYIGKATIQGYRIYETGYGYPGIKYGLEEKVKGEVYTLENNEQLKQLDRLEGNGSLYTREFTTANLENGEQTLVITYVYNGNVDEMSIIKEEMQPWGSNQIEKYIWYACYGSNLSYERFMKYINNCSDTTPPKKWMPITIKHYMYFARESKTWENKAVAFINPEESNKAHTLGKMYLIKLEQYLEVKEQEGKMYTNELCLGYFDNKKIVTFTDIKVYSKNEPSEEYLNVIAKGLLDSYPSLPDYDIWEYLKSR